MGDPAEKEPIQVPEPEQPPQPTTSTPGAGTRKPMDWQLRDFWAEHGDKRGVPQGVRDLLNNAFTKVPVSSFPDLPSGKVVEVPGDVSIADAVCILAQNNIFSAPVTNPKATKTDPWSSRYLGMVDYPAVIMWVLEQAEMAATAFTTAVGVGAGAFGALGAVVMGFTGPAAVASLAAAAIGTAIAGGVAAEKVVSKDAPGSDNTLGQEFYRVILREEPFASTQVVEITKAYRWAPFLPIQMDDCMLTVLLLLSKFQLRSIPVVNHDEPMLKNVITQTAVVRGLSQCQGRDWFDSLASKSLDQLGLPLMTPDKVVAATANQLVLEAFKLMKDKGVGGLPVVEGPDRKLKGNISIRDVRFLLMQPDLFARRLDLTVEEFMKTVKWAAPEAGMLPALTCKATTTLGEVISDLAAHNYHRIYVVDKNATQVMGVVTLRDIIGCFVSEPDGYFNNYFGGTFKETLSHSLQRISALYDPIQEKLKHESGGHPP
ncbi:hypothetical protein KC19_5G035800 [Ceratodon purpureus]|uniref:CBS domain-containing protein n=1 Tax=Ceratodon purpureus TaxID=3225 RepID=A0A8T0HYB0_CERPU|nr:hypothetical protein KC19_5G035800 [Ceratodon purpureus]